MVYAPRSLRCGGERLADGRRPLGALFLLAVAAREQPALGDKAARKGESLPKGGAVPEGFKKHFALSLSPPFPRNDAGGVGVGGGLHAALGGKAAKSGGSP